MKYVLFVLAFLGCSGFCLSQVPGGNVALTITMSTGTAPVPNFRFASMPLGNGDIGLNVWVDPGGDLLFYISKTDAWGGEKDSTMDEWMQTGGVLMKINFVPGHHFPIRWLVTSHNPLFTRSFTSTTERLRSRKEGVRHSLPYLVDAITPSSRFEAKIGSKATVTLHDYTGEESSICRLRSALCGNTEPVWRRSAFR